MYDKNNLSKVMKTVVTDRAVFEKAESGHHKASLRTPEWREGGHLTISSSRGDCKFKDTHAGSSLTCLVWKKAYGAGAQWAKPLQKQEIPFVEVCLLQTKVVTFVYG